ncbi:galactosyltransferase-related protein [Tenacibaculum sp. TC6]|uniref:galactosyltransferase-related protein n=1 Tax=Tenacibaculum sp. TC6 TaxID=3423223 RepID=UPI003D366595
MKGQVNISASIVLYKESLDELQLTIDSFLSIPVSKKLYLIDNTKNARFKNVFKNSEIDYIENRKNVGFGRGHNQILNYIDRNSEFHLILNPDVIFRGMIILKLCEELSKDSELAMIAPKILFPNGEFQYSCRRYPSIIELFIRRISPLKSLFSYIIEKGQYADKDLSLPFYPEYLTGCFQLYKTSDFVKLNGFDERYFLYMEDIDICKKIDATGLKKMYYPLEQVYHNLKQESSKKIKPLFYHIVSAIKYFKKWGFS